MQQQGMPWQGDAVGGVAFDYAPKHQGRPVAIVPAIAGLSNQMNPRLEALVKCQIQLDDDEDDDIVNNNTKNAKRAHIADDDDADVDPLKPATQDIEDVFVDTDAELERTNRTRKTASRICLIICPRSRRKGRIWMMKMVTMMTLSTEGFFFFSFRCHKLHLCFSSCAMTTCSIYISDAATVRDAR